MTPSFSIAATERVLPKLSLDFTTGSLDPRVTFERALNTATRTNSSGYIETVAANTPRFDYDPITLKCNGLLIEESRQNIFIKSEEFDDSAWFKSSCTISQNAIVSPSGSQTADRMIENTGTVFSSVMYNNSANITSGTTYTFSIYAKANGRNYLGLYFQGSTFPANNRVAWFDLSTQQTSAQSGVAVTMKNAGNGWYRCSITATATASSTGLATSSAVFIASAMGAASTITGNGTSGFYLWGGQLEVGAFPTSYIPTTTTALTRNSDVATATGQGVAAQGTFVVDATIASGKTLLTSGSVTFAATASTAQKTSVAYDTNSVRKSINAASVTGTSGATAGTDITLGNGGIFRSLKFYAPKLVDAELQAFSK